MSFTNSQTRQVVAFRASAAATSSGTGVTFPTGYHSTLHVSLNVTAVSGTTPSMTVTIDWSNDGTTWYSADPVDTFTAITAASNKVKEFTVKGNYARLNWTITGTTPSFTFAASALIKD